MSTITVPVVRCKLCAYKTSDVDLEDRHVVSHSINFAPISDKAKSILRIFNTMTFWTINDVDMMYPEIIKIIDGIDITFDLVDCMELVK